MYNERSIKKEFANLTKRINNIDFMMHYRKRNKA